MYIHVLKKKIAFIVTGPYIFAKKNACPKNELGSKKKKFFNILKAVLVVDMTIQFTVTSFKKKEFINSLTFLRKVTGL